MIQAPLCYRVKPCDRRCKFFALGTAIVTPNFVCVVPFGSSTVSRPEVRGTQMQLAGFRQFCHYSFEAQPHLYHSPSSPRTIYRYMPRLEATVISLFWLFYLHSQGCPGLHSLLTLLPSPRYRGASRAWSLQATRQCIPKNTRYLPIPDGDQYVP